MIEAKNDLEMRSWGKKTRTIPNLGFGKTLKSGQQLRRGTAASLGVGGEGQKKVQVPPVPACQKPLGFPSGAVRLGRSGR